MVFCRGGPSSSRRFSNKNPELPEAAKMAPTALEKSLAQRTGAGGVCIWWGRAVKGDETHKGSQFEAQNTRLVPGSSAGEESALIK